MPESVLTLEKYFFWLVIYSMVGWVYESILESFRQKKLVNRGFLNGPYLPIYGTGALLDVLILGWLDNPVVLFLASAILTNIVEFLTSYIMEKIYHVRWWDYNDFKFVIKGKVINVGKFNINGRVCLAGALAFGTLSIVLVYFVHPMVSRFTNSISQPLFHYICTGLIILVLLDCLITVISLSGFNDKLKALTGSLTQIKNGIVDNVQSTAAYEKLNGAYSKFLKTLTAQQRRLFDSFPRLKVLGHNRLADEIRKFLFRKKQTDEETEKTEEITDDPETIE